MEIIITDLTRFNNLEKVCIAGINQETGECVRPQPYIKLSKCEKHDILPGTVIDGDFTKKPNLNKPHVEDYSYKRLKKVKIFNSNEFEKLLENDIVNSISTGFNYDFPEQGKVIPKEYAPSKSIITIKINTNKIEIVKDGFKEGKIRLHLLDNDGKRFSFLSITDLGFYNYAMEHFNDLNFPDIINNFIRRQTTVFLRVGLGREYKGGFWIQINGIYTFPDFDRNLRKYN